MSIWEIIIASGIPTAIFGIMAWWFKRHIDKKEKLREEREKNTEKLMLFIMQTGRATNILAEATAKAVQRIPDAHCNGDMHAALAEAARIQNEEKDFIMNQGIKHIFED